MDIEIDGGGWCSRKCYKFDQQKYKEVEYKMKGRGSKFDKCEDKVGNTLSALLFVLVMIPLTLLLRKIKISNQLKKRRERINHVLFKDNLKLCAKSEDQLKSLINTVRIFPDDITLDFGLSKCDLLIMKIGKMLRTERIMGTR